VIHTPSVSSRISAAASCDTLLVRRLRPSNLPEWPEPFDAEYELNWGRPGYGRRLLREHLDQSHDGASRRRTVIDSHVRRLLQLLPRAPARVLDAACGPGLYAVLLAGAGHEVTGIDINPAALRHARLLSAPRRGRGRAIFKRTDLLEAVPPAHLFDAAILIYHVLEAFPRRQQPVVLRRLATMLTPGGRLIVEMRLRPDHPPGRIPWWDVVEQSVLSDRRHLLIGDSTYDVRRNTYVLREFAIFDDGAVASQQTSGWLCPVDGIPRLFARGGFQVTAMYDGWSRSRGNALSESLLVVARRIR
jgi:SAM-dependent methyltransferase